MTKMEKILIGCILACYGTLLVLPTVFSETATNLHGRPMPSLTATQAIGTRGEALLRDFTLLEKLASFNRERIPERVVHAKGAGAHGYFEVTHDISQYTKAKFLNGIGKRTAVTVRFSTETGEAGTPDTAIDTNGFAVKFFTEDGNYDLVGNNLDSFPIRDPMLFPDMNRSRKRHPQTHKKCPDMFWDFISHRPESTLHTISLFADYGRPDGYRKMDACGVHTFKLVNKDGKGVYIKLHWKAQQRGPALTHTQAAELAGTNPEYKTEDLYNAIANGDFPWWTLDMQVMSEETAATYHVNPFDVTKVWREEDFPRILIGKMVLNRNPGNYFAEVEQLAFSPSNMVPGIEPSPDRILAARMFAYQDAQRYRLGVNFPQLPVNRPVAPVNSYVRDGKSCHGDNGLGTVNYFPNSFGGLEPDPVRAGSPSFRVEGIVDRYDIPEDNFSDSKKLLEKDIDAEHRKRLVAAIADHLGKAKAEIQERVLANIFRPVSESFADEIKAALPSKPKTQG